MGCGVAETRYENNRSCVMHANDTIGISVLCMDVNLAKMAPVGFVRFIA